MNELHNQGNSDGMAKAVYVLYLASVVIGLTGVIGVIIAYVNKSEAPDWLQSHYQFQIRTFWIGCLFTFIGLLLMLVLVGWVVLLFTVIWLIVRSVKGLQMLDKKIPHPHPTTWMF